MPSIGHLAVGLAAARVKRPPEGVGLGAWTLLLVILSFLPDADVVAFRLGIPYGAPLGHRGASLMAHEAILFLPVWIVAAWPRR